MKNISYLNDILNKGEIAVLGLGVSNLPLIDFLLSKGTSVRGYDKKTREELEALADELEAKGVSLVLGENYLDSVKEKVIFRSPGVRPDVASLKSAVEKGAILTSEMELFLTLTDAEIVAITGSDGKTTTTTLTYKFLDAEKKKSGKGRAFVGGNIGTPLLPRVEDITADDVCVVELSSFQLMGMTVGAHSAAITNLTPNHLNWHTDMEEYASAKKNIFGTGTKRAVLNADDELSSSIELQDDIEKIYFSSRKGRAKDIIPENAKNASALYIKDGSITVFEKGKEITLFAANDIKLPGRHNIENYMTAIALTWGKVSREIYREIAQSFGGVEHRLEYVATVGGVKYYNSSIDSTPARTAAALSALSDKPVVICGGSDKNTPFEPLALALCQNARAVVLNGQTAQKIAFAIKNCPLFEGSGLEVYSAKALGEAIDMAKNIAHAGDTVLLSPACASFDQFKNFEERGHFFKTTVNSWNNE